MKRVAEPTSRTYLMHLLPALRVLNAQRAVVVQQRFADLGIRLLCDRQVNGSETARVLVVGRSAELEQCSGVDGKKTASNVEYVVNVPRRANTLNYKLCSMQNIPKKAWKTRQTRISGICFPIILCHRQSFVRTRSIP